MFRKFARPMLASVFVWDGVEAVRSSTDHISGTESLLNAARSVVPAPYSMYVPKDAELVSRALGGVKIAAASSFALSKAPRTSAAVLALSHLPTVFGRNAFWKSGTAEEKAARRSGFITNTALLGALTILIQDTEGNPSLRWRAQSASKQTARKVQAALPTKSEAQNFSDKFVDHAATLTGQAQGFLADTADKAQDFINDNRGEWESAGRSILSTAKDYADNARESVGSFMDDNLGELSDVRQELFKSAHKNTKSAKKSAIKAAHKAQKKADKAMKKAKKKVESLGLS